jgi:hypothetical protein
VVSRPLELQRILQVKTFITFRLAEDCKARKILRLRFVDVERKQRFRVTDVRPYRKSAV